MEAFLPRSLPFLLLSAVTAVAGVGPSSSSPSVPVLKPFNLMKKSYNFNTTLYWDYNITSTTPYFQVQYKFYKIDNWTIVENCGNISRRYCDLSENIADLDIYYSVRVKAFVGSESSEYAQTEINLINDGIIGPSILNASYDSNFVVVDIWYPDVPPFNGKKNVGDYFEDLTYDIYHENESEEAHECDYFGCSYKVVITNQTRYCFWAQGQSDEYPMTMEKSKEICIHITETKGTSDRLVGMIIGILVGVSLLLVLIFCIIKRKIEAKSMLPVSLNSIAKVMTTQIFLPSDQITRYDQVSVSPVDSSEEKMTPEEADKVLNVSDESDIRESIDHGYQSSVGETEQRTDEDQDDKEEPSSNNYYHTENSDSTLVCVTEDEVTEQEPLRDIRPLTNAFGYDKPHCPL